MSYKKLNIWKLSQELRIEIHKISITELSTFEKYETVFQVRRSNKSVRSNIVEGYGRRRYNKEFTRFLIFAFAFASNLETQDHLEVLFETNSFKNEKLYTRLLDKVDHLGRMLNKYIAYVEKH